MRMLWQQARGTWMFVQNAAQGEGQALLYRPARCINL
jgi:hypothetical protein